MHYSLTPVSTQMSYLNQNTIIITQLKPNSKTNFKINSYNIRRFTGLRFLVDLLIGSGFLTGCGFSGWGGTIGCWISLITNAITTAKNIPTKVFMLVYHVGQKQQRSPNYSSWSHLYQQQQMMTVFSYVCGSIGRLWQTPLPKHL